jgi:nicotinamidase-related amidase
MRPGGVESTARDAADRGYGCILAEDATTDYDPDAHDAALRALTSTSAGLPVPATSARPWLTARKF